MDLSSSPGRFVCSLLQHLHRNCSLLSLFRPHLCVPPQQTKSIFGGVAKMSTRLRATQFILVWTFPFGKVWTWKGVDFSFWKCSCLRRGRISNTHVRKHTCAMISQTHAHTQKTHSWPAFHWTELEIILVGVTL